MCLPVYKREREGPALAAVVQVRAPPNPAPLPLLRHLCPSLSSVTPSPSPCTPPPRRLPFLRLPPTPSSIFPRHLSLSAALQSVPPPVLPLPPPPIQLINKRKRRDAVVRRPTMIGDLGGVASPLSSGPRPPPLPLPPVTPDMVTTLSKLTKDAYVQFTERDLALAQGVCEALRCVGAARPRGGPTPLSSPLLSSYRFLCV